MIELGAEYETPNGEIRDNVLKSPNEIYTIAMQRGVITEQDSKEFLALNTQILEANRTIEMTEAVIRTAKDLQFELMSKYYPCTAIDRS
jgi:hypothetical protein